MLPMYAFYSWSKVGIHNIPYPLKGGYAPKKVSNHYPKTDKQHYRPVHKTSLENMHQPTILVLPKTQSCSDQHKPILDLIDFFARQLCFSQEESSNVRSRSNFKAENILRSDFLTKPRQTQEDNQDKEEARRNEDGKWVAEQNQTAPD